MGKKGVLSSKLCSYGETNTLFSVYSYKEQSNGIRRVDLPLRRLGSPCGGARSRGAETARTMRADRTGVRTRGLPAKVNRAVARAPRVVTVFFSGS